MIRRLAAVLLSLCFLLAAGPAGAEADADALMAELRACALRAAGAADLQAWVDGALTDTAEGNGGWLLIALRQDGAAFDGTACREKLEKTVAETEIRSLTKALRIALTLQALGSASPFIAAAADRAAADPGLMPQVFALHLLNNGAPAESLTREDAARRLLELQLADGGWAVIGSVCDVDCTAMTLQALAPMISENPEIRAAADRGLAALSAAQLENGGFTGMGVENAESSAQVLLALSALGLDEAEEPRLIRNGHTVLDALAGFRLADGGYAHDRTSGRMNETATVQAFCALAGLRRMRRGGGPLYVFDGAPAAAASGADGESREGKETAFAPQTDPASQAVPTPSDAPILQPAPTSRVAPAPQDVPASLPAPAKEVSAPVPAGAVLLLGLLACGAAWGRKKRNWRTYAWIAGLTGLGIALAFTVEIRTPEHYYAAPAARGTGLRTVISIRCDSVAGRNAYAPADGVILGETEIWLAEGKTAFDQLAEATRQAQIQMEYDGTVAGAYVRGIGYLYEYDFGNLSGWMYRINGKMADVGAGQYTLREGDRIDWVYTTNIGKDVE